MPSASPSRGCRVVAETERARSGTRSSSFLISVPLPTPDGPVMTKTLADAPSLMRRSILPKGSVGLAVEERDELGALALGEAADRLRRGDPALVQDPVRLHAAVLGNREEHVEDLRGHHVLGGVEKDGVDVGAARLQVLLQFGASGA